ncbi:hypothetical protein BDV39DRAFT_180141 [Aspergillus sergii]|uniref:Uncharacterized protein n=1 Tax=Aspergillus sergii TaxID=1034303 RepID=A0A5N6WWR6_9EURO|nr:hypothetical protein BDV39DRAFT_180141 [Aspergillus sergii]
MVAATVASSSPLSSCSRCSAPPSSQSIPFFFQSFRVAVLGVSLTTRPRSLSPCCFNGRQLNKNSPLPLSHPWTQLLSDSFLSFYFSCLSG